MVQIVRLGLVVRLRPREREPAMVGLRADNTQNDPGNDGKNVCIDHKEAERHGDQIRDQKLKPMAVDRAERGRGGEFVVDFVDVLVQPFVGVKQPMAVEKHDLIHNHHRKQKLPDHLSVMWQFPGYPEREKLGLLQGVSVNDHEKRQ